MAHRIAAGDVGKGLPGIAPGDGLLALVRCELEATV
jgi:hypothetical protein